jgi:putative endonuclease
VPIRIKDLNKSELIGSVVQSVRIRACHARGRGFESRPDRRKLLRNERLFYFMNCYVYIIELLVDATYYKGFSTDPYRRLEQHNLKLSRYTSIKIPRKLVYLQRFDTKSEALIREKQLKRANSKYILWLINESEFNLLK